MLLTFEKLGHVYGNGSGISVSTLISQYKNKFDSDFWLKWKAWEHALYPNESKEISKEKFKQLRKELKYSFDDMQRRDEKLFRILTIKYPELSSIVTDDIAESLRLEWKNKNETSKKDGTLYHDHKEKTSYEKGVEINPFTSELFPVFKPYVTIDELKIQNIDLGNLEKGYYPELILNLGNIYGQADRTWIGDNKQVWIRDYKTNETLKTSNPFQKMKGFLAHLDDCEFNHYSLQLSLYGYIFESYGYKIVDLAIDHYNREIKVPYLRKEVENMVTEYELSIL